jgi:hypothetical protein
MLLQDHRTILFLRNCMPARPRETEEASDPDLSCPKLRGVAGPAPSSHMSPRLTRSCCTGETYWKENDRIDPPPPPYWTVNAVTASD